MSDAPDIEQPQQAPAGVWNHYCDHEGCKKWGGFGYAEPSGQRWYCGEHRHVGEERRR